MYVSKPTAESSSNLSEAPRSTFSKVAPSKIRGRQVKQKPKILFIGDSISSYANIKAVAEATDAEIVTAKAYSSVHDDESNIAKDAAFHPNKNFTDVVRAEVAKDDFKNLILQAGSVDITNLKTAKNAEMHLDYFQQKAVISARNIFSAGVNAIVQQPALEKVVILKHIPRYDPAEVDPLQLKATLSQLFNSTLNELWVRSPYKERIHIGSHNMDCSGSILASRYRNIKTGKYDGIHLFGSSGSKFYTLSILNILRAAGLTSEEHDFHLTCPQAQYRNAILNREGNSLRGL